MTHGRAGARSGSPKSKLTIAPLAGPFRVTSQAVSEVVFGTTAKTITWDVAGTDIAPIGVANVKLSLVGSDGASHVIAESTPNDGSWSGAWPNVAVADARVKVEAIGNVFFDVSDAALTSVAAPTLPVSGTVPPTLTLTLGTPASFGAFTPGVDARLRRHDLGHRHLDGRRRRGCGQRSEPGGARAPRQRRVRDAVGAPGPQRRRLARSRPSPARRRRSRPTAPRSPAMPCR